jgi:hypothetical protein
MDNRFTDGGGGLKIYIPDDRTRPKKENSDEPSGHDEFRITYQNLTGIEIPDGIGHEKGEEINPPEGWIRLPLAIRGRINRSVPALMWRPDPSANIFIEDWITKDTPLDRIQFSAFLYARKDVSRSKVEKILEVYLPGIISKGKDI